MLSVFDNQMFPTTIPGTPKSHQSSDSSASSGGVLHSSLDSITVTGIAPVIQSISFRNCSTGPKKIQKINSKNVEKIRKKKRNNGWKCEMTHWVINDGFGDSFQRHLSIQITERDREFDLLSS